MIFFCKFIFNLNLKIVKYHKRVNMSSACSVESVSSKPNGDSKCALVVFDFDHTIVGDNSDTVVKKLLCSDVYPTNLKAIHHDQGWTAYMSKVFETLNKYGVKPLEIREAIRCIPEIPGTIKLIKTLVDKYKMDVIIASDANSAFINEWLDANDLICYIKTIITNPAEFNEYDLLVIKPFEYQAHCNLCSTNICKGSAVKRYIDQNQCLGKTFEFVIYIGDGGNDICPALNLDKNDIACAREGYSMHKQLTSKTYPHKLKSRFIIWKDGNDLLKKLQQYIEL